MTTVGSIRAEAYIGTLCPRIIFFFSPHSSDWYVPVLHYREDSKWDYWRKYQYPADDDVRYIEDER